MMTLYDNEGNIDIQHVELYEVAVNRLSMCSDDLEEYICVLDYLNVRY
jgi:hypothetical protein